MSSNHVHSQLAMPKEPGPRLEMKNAAEKLDGEDVHEPLRVATVSWKVDKLGSPGTMQE